MSMQVIQLDDLQPLIRGHSVFMKMDIEGYELNALGVGIEFFKNVDVNYIQIEFTEELLQPSITQLLAEHGSVLFKDKAGGQVMYTRHYKIDIKS